MQSAILQSYVFSTIEIFVKLGISEDDLVKNTGLSLSDFHNSSDDTALVEISELLKIYENALAQSKQRNIGLAFGQLANIGIYGIVGYAMLSAKTDIDAVKIALKYQMLVLGSLSNISLGANDKNAYIRLSVLSKDSDIVRFYVEQLFTSCMVFNKVLSGQPPRISELCLSYPDPGYKEEYEKIFGCQISFDSVHNEIRFDPEILRITLPNKNLATSQACTDICDELLDTLLQKSSTKFRLSQILRTDFLHYSEMENAAKYFNCEQRTLRRKLTMEGTSFREIRNGICEELAFALLQEKDSIEEVAVELGYSNARTFRKAYASWTGEPPSFARNAIKSAK